MHGLVLTHSAAFGFLGATLRAGQLDTLKVVTGWGLDRAWSDATRQQAIRLMPHLVVRTVAGDPSYHGGAEAYPVAGAVCAEVAPWLALRPDAWVEIGNEPNVADRGEAFIWEYRWHVLQTIRALRGQFPHARLLTPGLLLDGANGHQQRRWLDICGDVFAQCDAVAIHVYEHDSFFRPEQRHGTTGQVAEAGQFYGRFARRIVTEYGINDPATPPATKGQRYAAFVRANPLGAEGYLAYHYCDDRAMQPQYHLGPAGWAAYGAAVRV